MWVSLRSAPKTNARLMSALCALINLAFNTWRAAGQAAGRVPLQVIERPLGSGGPLEFRTHHEDQRSNGGEDQQSADEERQPHAAA
jgi:hypothetical protein